MTKEKLKQEAEKWLRKFLLCNDCKRKCHCIELNAYCEEQVLKAYIDSAEPREKRIAELEKENAKLKCECRTCVYTDSPCVRSDYPSKDGVCSHYKNVFEENVELKQENKVLAQNLEDTEILNKTYEKRFNDLEKENAELKEKKIKGCYFGKDELGNDFFAKCDCVDCQKRVIALLDLRKEYLNKINKESYLNNQLTKAKELLKRFIALENCTLDYEDINKAEQFLSEVEK